MSERKYFPVTGAAKARTHIDNERYLHMYQQSLQQPEQFWAEQGKCLDWFKPYSKIAANEHNQLGDVSTLADPSVVDYPVHNRLNLR